MNFLNKKIDPNESWEPVLKKFNCLPSISLENLAFSSSILTSDFPSSLVLKNSFSEICVYDDNFDLKRGQFKIDYKQYNDIEFIQVIGVIKKEQFNYLYTTSLSSKNLNIEFNTPMLGVERIKKIPFSESIILQNCTFWIHGDE